jgi:response regulator RpfG family c-di-GMP phosphodiesterase
MCVVGIALNLLLSELARLLHIPLYLDTVGTVLTAAAGGYLPGMLTGFLTNVLLWGINGDSTTIYYGVISVLIAALAAFLARKGWYRTFGKSLCSAPLLALVGGGLGSLLTFGLYKLDFGQELSAELAHFFFDNGLQSVFWAQLLGDILIDVVDKLLVVLIVCGLLRCIPDSWRYKLYLRFWQQNPLSMEDRRASRDFRVRGMSLRSKFLLLILVGMTIVAILTTALGYAMYQKQIFDAQKEMGGGVARVVASSFDANRVDEYMELGEKAEGYRDAEIVMARVRDSSADIKYVYVYQIREDGCHVVFDPDTAEEEGYEPGSIQPFDSAFDDVRDDLLAGRPIRPVINNTEEYGWLYTIYQPVQDSAGKTVCYAGVDIDMNSIMNGLYSYLARVLSLFVGIIAILLAMFLLLADSGIIMPINSMALAASRFAFDSEAHRSDGMEQVRTLGIRTGDEIENLYDAMTQTTADSVRYIAESQEKNRTIARMQENLILVLADMVESRDQFTGDHVKNTSEYTLIIMDQLKKEGIYTDQLTDEFVRNVYHSAPLHDIGKIRVSDMILNKPGKLTDEEFETMKLHTVYGRDVIEKAKKASSDVSYLNEAENLSLYHHEKWNGKGYPHGLSGEDIPLSARIMAVADVFDALVSKRSYKDPFPFEKAMDIIREGAGNHFDPNVAGAFMHAEDKVRRVLGERRAEEK